MCWDGTTTGHHLLPVLLHQLAPDVGVELLVQWPQFLPHFFHCFPETIYLIVTSPVLTSVTKPWWWMEVVRSLIPVCEDTPEALIHRYIIIVCPTYIQ